MSRALHPRVLYLRENLSQRDQRDLREYLAMLRRYFNIPADQPVFPPRTPAAPRQQRRRTPSATARNRANHPWRAPVERRSQP